MTPPSCGARLLIDDHGRAVQLACSALPGHPGTHTVYYADRLHQWVGDFSDRSTPDDGHEATQP